MKKCEENKLNKKIEILKKKLPIDLSFDIMGREISIGKRRGYFIFIDGFAKDEVLFYYLEAMQRSVKAFIDLDDFLAKEVSYIEAEVVKDDSNYEKLITSVLSGIAVLVLEDFDEYILIDSREYPARGISESEIEKVVRGSKDCFAETIVHNTALIRRRIRTSNLVFEMINVGEYSKTDVAISYIDGLVNEKVLNTVKEKLLNANVKSLLLGSQYIEEILFKRKWYNPLPQVKYTERPDVASAYLSEGHIVLVIDTSPVAIVLPVSIFYFLQHIGDYNMKYINGTIAKIVRMFSAILATIAAPLFLYLGDYTKVLDDLISKSQESGEGALFSFFVQIVILEIIFIILQMASLHIPTSIASMIGIVGGLILGDVAIKTGVFTSVSISAMVITVLSTYTIPSIEFSDAVRVFRLFLIFATGLFGLIGFIMSIVISVIITLNTETIKGSNGYIYPLIPFDYKVLKNLISRQHTNKK